jgi:hypothetical protein
MRNRRYVIWQCEIAATMTHYRTDGGRNPKRNVAQAAGYPEIFFFPASQLAIVLLKYE